MVSLFHLKSKRAKSFHLNFALYGLEYHQTLLCKGLNGL